MLEAVRLVETAQETAEGEAQRQALVIGLGIGTAPSALTAHGVNTTTVEIDPAVHAYATKYFDLPAECHVVIDDAVHFVDAAGNLGREYDYLIHDVFTGGAEPVELFTFEFLKGLHDLLKPDGAIAINYAGDLAMPSGRLVVRTIKAVFPTCRIFREDAGPTSSGSKRDFTNMVVFCTRSSRPLTFRRPVPADFLGSLTRRQSLLPEHEIEAGVFEERKGDGDIIRRGEMGRLEKWHRQSALGHWEIMRTVLPAAVWENW
ncbi:MAG: hypothetical protein M1832_005719 [Thelocarpon impressellum]|nr:MAG: hypothetical protein M1832_005719 [Thelocarpon impressellum]